MAKILAVDDSEPMRQIISQTLFSGGHEVVLASDGEEGLKKFAQAEFDLVVTDINMPVLDGFGLVRQIREGNKNVPILALTTESEDEKRRSGEAAGVDGWIVKPFKPAQFLAIIKQVLS